MRLGLFADPHLEEPNLDEFENIFNEIISYDVHEWICLGDYLEKKPTPKEIYFATKWAILFKEKGKKFTLIEGNHPAIENDFSSEDYLSFLGTNIKPTYVIDNCYFGHCLTEKSDRCFTDINSEKNRYEINTKDVEKYKYTVFGHQHTYQKISKNIYHLGSCRFIDFGETTEPNKYIAIIDNKIQFIKLKNVIPMVDVKDIKELSTISQNSKVRCIITDFNILKNHLVDIEKYKKYFTQFKIKLELNQQDLLPTQKQEKHSLQNNIKEWLDNIKDKEVKQELIEEFSYEELI